MVDEVVAQSDVAGELAAVLAGELDVQIGVMDSIFLNDNVCTPIDVNAVGGIDVAVIGITK